GRLIDQYWAVLLDPELPLNKIFNAARFPEDLEEMAAAIEQVVADNSSHILLIYIDVIEFKGKHIKTFYQRMADRFAATYAERLAARQEAGELGEVDPLVAVMLATRWFFYFFTVEKCFGVPMHFARDPPRPSTNSRRSCAAASSHGIEQVHGSKASIRRTRGEDHAEENGVSAARTGRPGVVPRAGAGGQCDGYGAARGPDLDLQRRGRGRRHRRRAVTRSDGDTAKPRDGFDPYRRDGGAGDRDPGGSAARQL